jgi:hypothetical protein
MGHVFPATVAAGKGDLEIRHGVFKVLSQNSLSPAQPTVGRA